MRGGSRGGGSPRRTRVAGAVAILLGVGLWAGGAHARGAWCGELPLSLDAPETPALCAGPALPARGAVLAAPAALSRLLRLPATRSGRAHAVLASEAPLVDAPAMVTASPRWLWLRLGLFAGIAGALQFVEAPRQARWTSTPGFDDDARSALRARSRSGRRAARIASDVLLGAVAGQLGADWVIQRERYPLLRTALVDGGWIAFSQIGMHASKAGAGRQRPYVNDCLLDSGYISECNSGRGDNESFYSGHTSWSATFAGLVCARADAFDPGEEAGIRWGAIAQCGLAVSASVATGLLRVVADRHHLSDVGVGWTAGFLAGYALPRTFDYRGARGGPFSRFELEPMRVGKAWGVRTALRF